MAKRRIKTILKVYDDGTVGVESRGSTQINPARPGRAAKATSGSSNKPRSRAARPEFIAKYGRKTVKFFSVDDAKAQRYASTLLAAKMGGQPSSLKRSGRKESK